eukprot:COSAG05_NODE_1406_length_4967_cov_7.938180_5_plen_95_part_00
MQGAGGGDRGDFVADVQIRRWGVSVRMLQDLLPGKPHKSALRDFIHGDLRACSHLGPMVSLVGSAAQTNADPSLRVGVVDWMSASSRTQGLGNR